MTSETPTSAAEYRLLARRLLKAFRSGSADAAARLRRLRSFADRSDEQLPGNRDRVRLKHALAVVALENGFASWTALKSSCEAAPKVRDGHEMYERGMDLLLNRWFARYDEARASLEELGGYLLPYGSQFFICEEEGIRILGLDPDDPDWRKIGWNWVEPADREAFSRLKAQREQAKREQAKRKQALRSGSS